MLSLRIQHLPKWANIQPQASQLGCRFPEQGVDPEGVGGVYSLVLNLQ